MTNGSNVTQNTTHWKLIWREKISSRSRSSSPCASECIFGGCPSRWSFGFSWIREYIDTMYSRTISHEKLIDLVDEILYSMMLSIISSRRPQSIISWMDQLRSVLNWSFCLSPFLGSLTAWSTASAIPFQDLMVTTLVLQVELYMTQRRGWFTLNTRSVMA